MPDPTLDDLRSDDDTPRLMRVREVSKLLALHPQTVRDWCMEGRLDAKRIGESWRIPRTEIFDSDGEIRDEIGAMPEPA